MRKNNAHKFDPEKLFVILFTVHVIFLEKFQNNSGVASKHVNTIF